MDLTPVLVLMVIFGGIAAIVVGPSWLKSRDRKEVQATIRAAIEKGQPLPAEVIDAMSKEATRNVPSRSRDLRRGVIWVAVGLGLAAFSLLSSMGWSNDDWDASVHVGNGLLGVAAIPTTIGIAFIVLSFFNKNKD